MTALYNLTRNSLWYAFNALDNENNNRVAKSKLMVFTSNLGSLLGLPDVEKGISEHRSTSYLKYNDFMFYLQLELFMSLPKELSPKNFQKYHHIIEDVCWLVSKHKYKIGQTLCPEDFYLKLFRIFCLISEYQESSNSANVTINSDEIGFITDFYNKILGNPSLCSDSALCDESNVYSFGEFVDFINKEFIARYEKTAVIEATNEIYDIIVGTVIKMGPLKKLLTSIGPWWEMWFILKQHSLSWCSSKSKKDHFDELEFYNCDIKIENLSGTQFSLSVNSKTMLLNAEDFKTKLQWITAFKTALKHSKILEPYQLQYFTEKRELRKQERQAKLKLEEEKHLVNQQIETLEREKEVKLQLEQKLKEEEEMLKSLKLREEKLLSQLEEERQAKRDEEIVRNLQSRILAEEWEKIESLEQKHMKQEEELREERRRRKQLEEWQQKRKADENQLTATIAALEKENAELYGTLKKNKLLSKGAKKKDLDTINQPLKRTLSVDLSHIATND